ncbi:copper amine oxidase N-terminal domain-containing protein [Solibacillus sp. FSL K6-1523]|uniref:copper amine oxidase N-terminal domain-containing protein n=1 Tax=Solibacillus sp. FSL K6-1523 TaxID=2921471 RepID=UPI0030FC7EE3
MKKLVLFFAMLSLLLSPSLVADAHSGRTDSNGGHNCSEKSKAKGLCTGYHYHNGGSGSSSSSAPKYTAPKQTYVSAPKPVLVTADVYINNVAQNYNPGAYIKNNTTLVPMKAIFESLGATLTYDNATKKVTAYKDNKTIAIGVGNKKAYIEENGITTGIDLTHAAEVHQGTTMVPLRFVSQSLGANITFNTAASIVYISTK